MISLTLSIKKKGLESKRKFFRFLTYYKCSNLTFPFNSFPPSLYGGSGSGTNPRRYFYFS